ncbi:MAG: substrate-binding domain-containing protein, partial [Arthrobacter sp.]
DSYGTTVPADGYLGTSTTGTLSVIDTAQPSGTVASIAVGLHPTALFAVNDFAAIGAMGALRSHGLTVGDDVAVVGFNDTSLAAELPIPLSSVRSPMLDIGRMAVQLLKRVLDGEIVKPVRLEPDLCVRESSA